MSFICDRSQGKRSSDSGRLILVKHLGTGSATFRTKQVFDFIVLPPKYIQTDAIVEGLKF